MKTIIWRDQQFECSQVGKVTAPCGSVTCVAIRGQRQVIHHMSDQRYAEATRNAEAPSQQRSSLLLINSPASAEAEQMHTVLNKPVIYQTGSVI